MSLVVDLALVVTLTVVASMIQNLPTFAIAAVGPAGALENEFVFGVLFVEVVVVVAAVAVLTYVYLYSIVDLVTTVTLVAVMAS